jgi:hypothetical protein
VLYSIGKQIKIFCASGYNKVSLSYIAELLAAWAIARRFTETEQFPRAVDRAGGTYEDTPAVVEETPVPISHGAGV